MADPDELRAEEEKNFWAKRDPIDTFKKDLEKNNLASSEELKEIEKEIDNEINDAVEFALNAEEPDPKELTRYIWAEE